MSRATPVAKEATRLVPPTSIHGTRSASDFRLIIVWNRSMSVRASINGGTPASTAATVTVSALDNVSRPAIISLAMVRPEGIR